MTLLEKKAMILQEAKWNAMKKHHIAKKYIYIHTHTVLVTKINK